MQVAYLGIVGSATRVHLIIIYECHVPMVGSVLEQALPIMVVLLAACQKVDHT